jgi:hypothetical protein
MCIHIECNKKLKVDLFTEFILKTINLKLEKKYKKYERVKRKETKSKCNEKY